MADKKKSFDKVLRRDAKAWDKAERPASALYGSKRLKQARKWIRKNPVSKVEWEFVEASIVRESIEDIMADITHPELRGSLNNIIGFTKLMMKGDSGPTTDIQSEDLQTVHESGQKILQRLAAIENRFSTRQ